MKKRKFWTCHLCDAQSVFYCCKCDSGSRVLHLLGMLGVGPFGVYFSRHVSSQPPCSSWNSGNFVIEKYSRFSALLLVSSSLEKSRQYMFLTIFFFLCFSFRFIFWWRVFCASLSITTATGRDKSFVELMAKAWFGGKLLQRYTFYLHFFFFFFPFPWF